MGGAKECGEDLEITVDVNSVVRRLQGEGSGISLDDSYDHLNASLAVEQACEWVTCSAAVQRRHRLLRTHYLEIGNYLEVSPGNL